jgi:hypothetical protein
VWKFINTRRDKKALKANDAVLLHLCKLCRVAGDHASPETNIDMTFVLRSVPL